MSTTLIAIAGLLILLLIAFIASGVGKLPPFVFRERCQGSAWRKAFPSSPKRDIREFLSLFVDAFGFPQEERLKFNPSDTILGIYRDLYPSKWMPDALEIETLANDLHSRFGLTLNLIWSEQLTLGDLFSKTQSSKGNMTPNNSIQGTARKRASLPAVGAPDLKR